MCWVLVLPGFGFLRVLGSGPLRVLGSGPLRVLGSGPLSAGFWSSMSATCMSSDLLYVCLCVLV